MNETTKIVIAGGGGLAIGLASGYILAVKTMQARIDSQIEEVKAHYAAKHEKYISETRAVMDEAIDRKVAEVVSERLGYCANNPVNQQVCFIGKLSLEFPRLHEILLRSNKI